MMQPEHWGTFQGQPIFLYVLKNEHGVEVRATSYGARLIGILLPQRGGGHSNIVLSYDRLADYISGRAYLGATIGRYANRIANGLFVLNGKSYQLPCNEQSDTLHGGFHGFDKQVWSARVVPGAVDAKAIEFSYTSPDGDEGFPGTLNARITYTLNNQNELEIQYWAESDSDTVLNLTNHTYFNLTGSADRKILDHELFLNSEQYLPIDEKLIPTGGIASVADTPFDFRTPKRVGQDLGVVNKQLQYAKGYDFNWIIHRQTSSELELAARVSEKVSGRTMEIFTSQPGVQFYSGNRLEEGSDPSSRVFAAHSGLCLETQHFPDSVNKPQFPSTVLRAGSIFRSSTVLRFHW
jgi:aldose 1-epimerase